MKKINLDMKELKEKFLKEAGIDDMAALVIKGTNYGDYCLLIKDSQYSNVPIWKWKDISNCWEYEQISIGEGGKSSWEDKTEAIMDTLESGKEILQFRNVWEMCEHILSEKIERS